MSKQAIQAHATALQVPCLLHFTRLANLPSIMANGLYPVGRIHEIGVTPQINDQIRLDGHLDGTSLSIAFPNFKMLYKYRMENQDIEWVVLGIHPAVLWLKDCAYCRHNAADSRISQRLLPELKTIEAFTGMFEEIEGTPPRNEQKLKTFDPTDGQAEVLVFDVIEPSHVIGAVFENAATMAAHSALLGERQKLVNQVRKGYFASRSYVRT